MSLFHHLISYASSSSYRKFDFNLSRPEEIQKAKLDNYYARGLLKNKENLEDLAPQTYEDFRAGIEVARKEGKGPFSHEVDHFERTSGSTSQLKWIPYSKLFKEELDFIASSWLRDLYQLYPEIHHGAHYWSLSWLPDDMRKEARLEDHQALPWFKSFLLAKVMVNDEAMKKLPSSHAFMTESLIRMISKEVSLISVWSPTFLLRLLDLLLTDRDFISEELKKRGAHLAHEVLQDKGELSQEKLKILFPKLTLISAWESSSSQLWAQKVKETFSWVNFQGKGLWATEGVVTFPFKGDYPLAIGAHYYEFWCPQEQKVFQLKELEKDQVVQPLITSGNGFKRYLLEDDIRVRGFLGKTPCFEFLGRRQHVDLAGEKISQAQALIILSNIKEKWPGLEAICLLAGPQAGGLGYGLLLEGEMGKDAEQVASFLEEELRGNYHYQLARELGQLRPAQVVVKKQALNFYYQLRGHKIKVEGNIKPEPLIQIDEEISGVLT